MSNFLSCQSSSSLSIEDRETDPHDLVEEISRKYWVVAAAEEKKAWHWWLVRCNTTRPLRWRTSPKRRSAAQFTWKKSLNFEGLETAGLRSLLKKCPRKSNLLKASTLISKCDLCDKSWLGMTSNAEESRTVCLIRVSRPFLTVLHLMMMGKNTGYKLVSHTFLG